MMTNHICYTIPPPLLAYLNYSFHNIISALKSFCQVSELAPFLFCLVCLPFHNAYNDVSDVTCMMLMLHRTYLKAFDAFVNFSYKSELFYHILKCMDCFGLLKK